jgi:hypothetical protein
MHAYKVTDEDVTAARAAGLSADQIFELAVCAAIGQATRQYDTAVWSKYSNALRDHDLL